MHLRKELRWGRLYSHQAVESPKHHLQPWFQCIVDYTYLYVSLLTVTQTYHIRGKEDVGCGMVPGPPSVASLCLLWLVLTASQSLVEWLAPRWWGYSGPAWIGSQKMAQPLVLPGGCPTGWDNTVPFSSSVFLSTLWIAALRPGIGGFCGVPSTRFL